MTYLERQFGLNGRTVVVTGGGGTLCGAVAEACARCGGNVALWGRRMTTLEEKIAEIKDREPSVALDVVVVDLLDESAVKSALRETVGRHGKVDVLVNGVGGSSVRRPLPETDLDEFKRVMELNLLAGCVTPTKHVADYWVENGIKGAVVNIASMASYVPLSGAGAYSSAKAAVVNQTLAHAKELAPHGIRVNAIAPGFFLGKQNRHLLIDDNGNPTARGSDVLAHTPMGRFGSPEEVGAAAVFLAADGAAFISGAVLPIDGAYLCQNI